MSTEGYYRFATVSGELLVFSCEDDIWSVPLAGGDARRLTHTTGWSATPRVSPDGKWVAYVNVDEAHPEVYVVPTDGGPPKRLSYLGSEACHVVAWSPDSSEIYFTSDGLSPFFRQTEIYAVSPTKGTPRNLNLGHARSFSVDSKGRMAIGRNALDPAVWKRYKGGTAGELWVDPNGKGHFHQLIKVAGNAVSPMWIGDRVYFLSDHEGTGNIYSCTPDGTDLKKHTDHSEYYVRFPATDGKHIVYTAGGRIYKLDCATDTESVVQVRTPSAEPHTTRKFVEASSHLESFTLDPAGQTVGLISRGQPLTMPLFEGPVVQHGAGSDVRYRLLTWLPDGKRFIVTNDRDKFERLELHHQDQSEQPKYLTNKDIGRAVELRPSPVGELAAMTNHRFELLLIDLQSGEATTLDRSPADRITGITWSPDGRWIAYACPPRFGANIIRIVDVKTKKIHDVTEALRSDWSPSFDPDGKYLYFLSNRDFNPVYDSQQFDLGFPASVRPYVVTLREDVPSPFRPNTSPFIKKDTDKQTEKQSDESQKKEITIDFEGISRRVLAFPVTEGLYGSVVAVKDRILYTRSEIKGLDRNFNWHADGPTSTLYAYDLEEQRETAFATDVSEFILGPDRQTLLYRSKTHMRVFDAQQAMSKGSDPGSGNNRQTGWLDMARAHVMVEPRKEWSQMYAEAWRLQREHFWDEDMSQVDWNLVFERYALLLPRVRTRSEQSDLIWEMQGELGTSHAYEIGGDYRGVQPYHRGFLGADLSWCEKSGGWKIVEILRGDAWERDCDSPLGEPGVGIKCGDIITAVNGRTVSEELAPEALLLKAANQHVQLTVKSGDQTRQVTVKALRTERFLRYRRWVEANRKYVHEKSDGKLGYLHIPDMGPPGYAEFHRGFLSEFHRDGLIIDVRYNRGGHVSGLLLQKLLRKRVGYDVSRWGEPQPYPSESVAGPLVALTNQFAGSDGDIFSHCFKLYKLGPLVGKRTWGGVIGITPLHKLVDGTITTQPEFSFWFQDVGWSVENYGTDPDYDVDIAPHHYKSGSDPQMDHGIALALDSLKKNPVKLPDFSKRPSLKLPAATRK